MLRLEGSCCTKNNLFVAYTVKTSSFASIVRVFNLQSGVKFTNFKNYDDAICCIFDHKSTFQIIPTSTYRTIIKADNDWTSSFYGFQIVNLVSYFGPV